MNQPSPQASPTLDANARARSELATRLFGQGRQAEAERLLRELIGANPNDPHTTHLLGLIAWGAGRRQEAIALLRRSVALAPDNPAVLSNLGGFYVSVGANEEAERVLRRALKIKPMFADALCNLGNVLRAKGDLAGAFDAYRRAAEAAPQMASAHNNLGIVFYGLGRMAEAEAAYSRARELDPSIPEVHNNLGNVLGELGKDAEAIASLNEAIRLRPAFAEAHCNLAKVQIRTEDLAEARKHLMTALSIQPDFAGAYNNLGILHRTEGSFAEAEACFRKAIVLDPSLNLAYAGITSARSMTPADRPLVEQLESALERSPGMAGDKRAHLHFALGKAYDDLGEWARAFAHYRQGNDIERDRRPRFDRAGFGAQLAALEHRFTPEIFERLGHAGSDSKRPILIVGMMRSGTSLIEQILASHPQVHGAGELIFFPDEDRRLRTDQKDPTAADVADVAARYLEHLRGLSADAPYVTDKMPHNFLHLGLIRLAFPQARIIHARRNPVDTCLSIYFQLFPEPHPYAYDLEDLAAFYRQYRGFMKHWRGIVPADRLLEIDYEDLVADQEGQTRRLLEYCGLPWDDACLAFQKNRRIVRTASAWQVRQSLYDSSVARWKNYEPFLGPLAGLLDEAES